MKRRTHILAPLAVLALLTAGASAADQGSFAPPILISSAGQSADVTLAGSLCKKARLEARVVASATAVDLKGIKTLIIVPGFSSKGLGAAGTSREEELQRVQALLKAAKNAGIPVLMMHIGGKARRGAQSDDFNTLAAEASRRMIVVKQGDEDGFFTTLAGQKKIPLDVVDKIAGILTPLGAAFTATP